MKKNLVLAVALLTLLLALTACSSRGKNTGTTPPGDRPAAEHGESAVTPDSGAPESAIEDAADAAKDAVDDLLPGESGTDERGGVSYGDMLENGTVEDAPTPSRRARPHS